MRSRSATLLLLLLAATASARPLSGQGTWCQVMAPRSAQARDSAHVADIALRALVQGPDTLVCYRVQQFRRDRAGAVVTLLPELLPKFSHMDLIGGGGEVRVTDRDSAVVLVRYR